MSLYYDNPLLIIHCLLKESMFSIFSGENSWFFFTITATIIYGVINFMYKVAAEHNSPSRLIVNISAGSISIISLTFILIFNYQFINLKWILIFAAINSSFFALGSVAKISALKKIPTSYTFPITKLNSILLIIYGLFLFNESPKTTQWIGIIISIGMLIYISLSSKSGKIEIPKFSKNNQEFIGILLALTAAVSTSFSMLTGKYASSEVPKMNYIFVSYSMVFIYTTIIGKIIKTKKKPKVGNIKKTILFGIIIGILNFTGYLCVLNAFETGPLTLIQGISSNSFVIPIILSIIVFKEKFGWKNFIVVILAIITIIIIKL